MKILLGCLLLIFFALQYRIWFGSGSMQEVWRLQQEAKVRAANLQELKSRNEALEAEVADLKRGLDAIEERARSELGMVSEDETFYQFVRNRGYKNNPTVIPRDATDYGNN